MRIKVRAKIPFARDITTGLIIICVSDYSETMSTPCLEDAKVKFGIRYLESIGLLPYPLYQLPVCMQEAMGLSAVDLEADTYFRDNKPKDMFSIYGDGVIRTYQPEEIWGPITRSEVHISGTALEVVPDDTEEFAAYVATKQKKRNMLRLEDMIAPDTHITVASFGVMNFEEAGGCRESEQKVKNYIKRNHSSVYDFDLDEGGNRQMVRAALRDCFPNFDDHHIIIIDCRPWEDPARKYKNSRHLGFHPDTIT